jgi:hypothetical protein
MTLPIGLSGQGRWWPLLQREARMNVRTGRKAAAVAAGIGA